MNPLYPAETRLKEGAHALNFGSNRWECSLAAGWWRPVSALPPVSRDHRFDVKRAEAVGSDVASRRRFVEVTARVHPFVQDLDDLDHTFLGDTIVENMNRSPDPCVFSRTARISDVEAADT
jgi:hypothetical protein